MKNTPNLLVEKYRIRDGIMASDESYGNNGIFIIPNVMLTIYFDCIVSDGGGWEHVSITPRGLKRCPTWDEMDRFKSMFWNEDEVVVQYHIGGKSKVNVHPYVLHLWKPIDTLVLLPPIEFV